MLVYCDLLKDENTNEANCEPDFHLQAFHQKHTIHGKCIKLCAYFPIVFSLTFCQQVANFLVRSHSTISIHFTFVSVRFYMLVALYLQLLIYTYIPNMRVTHILLESCLRVDCESHSCNLWALITLWLSCTNHLAIMI